MDETQELTTTLATKLNELLECHPVTGEKTTNKALGDAIGTRGQSVSLYRRGESQPSPELLLRIARYFGVSVDYLLTGVSSENAGAHSDLGLSEEAIEGLRALACDLYDMHGVSAQRVRGIVNSLLADDATYSFLGMMAKHIDQLYVAAEDAVREGDNTAKFMWWQLANYINHFTSYRMSINHLDVQALEQGKPYYQPSPPEGFPPPPAGSPADKLAQHGDR